MSSNYYLPSKIMPYLKRLMLEYRRSNDTILVDIISSAKVFIREETAYNDWNGGTYGHTVILFLPTSMLSEVPFKEEEELAERIRADLNVCNKAAENEFFNNVSFECEDVSDPDFQNAVSWTSEVAVDGDTLSIWSSGQIRLFISHRDIDKIEAKVLAEALADYGISAFVAHDTIEPMTTWQNEIIKGLKTMEVMLAFITDSFHKSTWTNQEIGYALGRGIPVISLKLQEASPEGFISTQQACRGSIGNPSEIASEIYILLSEKLGNKNRLQNALVTAFINSKNYTEAKERFDRLEGSIKKLSEEEVEQIIRGYESNSSLYQAWYLTKYQRLQNFLTKSSGEEFIIENSKIQKASPKINKALPF